MNCPYVKERELTLHYALRIRIQTVTKQGPRSTCLPDPRSFLFITQDVTSSPHKVNLHQKPGALPHLVSGSTAPLNEAQGLIIETSYPSPEAWR